MRIVDANGEDIHTAQVGDSLFLRFQITDDSSKQTNQSIKL